MAVPTLLTFVVGRQLLKPSLKLETKFKIKFIAHIVTTSKAFVPSSDAIGHLLQGEKDGQGEKGERRPGSSNSPRSSAHAQTTGLAFAVPRREEAGAGFKKEKLDCY